MRISYIYKLLARIYNHKVKPALKFNIKLLNNKL